MPIVPLGVIHIWRPEVGGRGVAKFVTNRDRIEEGWGLLQLDVMHPNFSGFKKLTPSINLSKKMKPHLLWLYFTFYKFTYLFIKQNQPVFDKWSELWNWSSLEFFNLDKWLISDMSNFNIYIYLTRIIFTFFWQRSNVNSRWAYRPQGVYSAYFGVRTCADYFWGCKFLCF